MLMFARPVGRFDDLPDLIDAEQLGRVLGIAERTVFKKARTGEIPKVVIPGRWLRSSIEAWLAAGAPMHWQPKRSK